MTEQYFEEVKGRWILRGENAFRLWKQKVDVWNAEVERYPEAEINFSKFDFPKHYSGQLSFDGYKFPSKGVANFYRAKFGESAVFFSKAIFGEGGANFQQVSFGNGNLDISEAIFLGDANFRGAEFGEGIVNFQKSLFKGHANFCFLRNSRAIKQLDFSKAIFEKSFDLSENELKCIPDLTGTKASNHILIDERYDLQRVKTGPLGYKKAKDHLDAARLRRLKEIAEDNKHHDAALRFHSDEMRAKRWQKEELGVGNLKSALDLLFSATSDYGQSILRPVFSWLLISLLLVIACCVSATSSLDWFVPVVISASAFVSVLPFTPLIQQLANSSDTPHSNGCWTESSAVFLLMAGYLWTAISLGLISIQKLMAAIELALANTYPFLASSRSVIEKAKATLYGVPDATSNVIMLPIWFNSAMMIHGTLSFVFLFLVGLALRNRFRI